MAPAQEPTVHVEVDRSTGAPIVDPALPVEATSADNRPWADWMRSQLGPEGLAATSAGGVDVVAAAQGAGARVLLAQHDTPRGGNEVLLRIGPLQPGMKRLSVYRLDAARRWHDDAMVPMEVRETPDREGKHEQRLFLPTGSVALVCLDPVQVRAGMEG